MVVAVLLSFSVLLDPAAAPSPSAMSATVGGVTPTSVYLVTLAWMLNGLTYSQKKRKDEPAYTIRMIRVK